jgi:dihydrofolate reductase
MSGRIVVTQYISLDGVIEDPVGLEDSGLGDWTGPFTRGPEGDKFKHDELAAAGALLLGRRTYDAFAAAWPHMHDETGYAERINNLPKLLASHSENASWGDTTVARDDGLIDAVKALKARTAGDILVFGSASVVHQLAPLRLIDEYRLMIYPTVLGRGLRLLPEGYATVLKTQEIRAFNDGIALVRYTPA